MTDDELYMQLALDEARTAAAEGEVPVGAVVVCDDVVVSRAHNQREQSASPSAHAEVLAIEQAARDLHRWRLSDCTVYVTLEPCLMCAGLMLNARIARCVFGAPDTSGGALGSVLAAHKSGALNHTFAITSGVCGEQSAQLLREFFRGRR